MFPWGKQTKSKTKNIDAAWNIFVLMDDEIVKQDKKQDLLAVMKISQEKRREKKCSSLLRSKERDKQEKHIKPQPVLSECSQSVKFNGNTRPSIFYTQALHKKPEINYKSVPPA